MSTVHKPAIVIEQLGEMGRLPDGGIINAGGVQGPFFTIDGKAVILADGTASDGSGPVIVVEGGTGATAVGYEHVQAVASSMWVINHLRGTRRMNVTIWDDTDEMVYADVVKIIDLNTVHVSFNTPVSGRAILMLF